MQRHRRRLLRGLLILVGLQVGCQASAPRPEPSIDLWRPQAAQHLEEARQTWMFFDDYCVGLGKTAADTAVMRPQVPLQALLVRPLIPDAWIAQQPAVEDLAQIADSVITYAYMHPEQTPEQLQGTVTQWCREAVRASWPVR